MTNILYNISQVLGITIIHSLWQGLVIYFILRIALIFSAQFSASKKYWLAVSSLHAVTGWFVYTLLNEIQVYNWLAVKPADLSGMPLLVALPTGIRQFNYQNIRYYYSIAACLPYISIIYITGLLLNTSRLVLARKKLNTIRKNISIDVGLQGKLQQFKNQLGIKDPVTIGLSKLIDVPCMAGYFKPVILLPFTLSTHLRAEEIEAILLHELSHLKRNDYLVNLMQQVLSILLFFNPCAQLINRIINEERENCCDDLVVAVTGNPLLYAKTLLKLEETRENNWQLALAATGKKYYLLNRIQRIMKTKDQTPGIRPALLAMLILTLGIGSIALLNPQIAQGKISIAAVKPAITALFADTTIRKAPLKKKLRAKTAHHVNKVNTAYVSVSDDKKLDQLNAEIQRHSEAVNNYYGSDAFKQTQEILQKKQKDIQELYSNPDLKKLEMEDMKIAQQFKAAWNGNEDMAKLQKNMSDAGKNISTYYSSADFKKLNDELEKKYGIPPGNHYYDDRDSDKQNYKKYQDDLQSHVPTTVKEQIDQLKKDGEKLQAQYNSPGLKEISKRLTIVNDSLKKKFGVTNMSLRKEQMEKLGKQMQAYQNDPKLKRELELLRLSVAKMTAYINSPEYKHHLEELKRQASSSWLEKMAPEN